MAAELLNGSMNNGQANDNPQGPSTSNQETAGGSASKPISVEQEQQQRKGKMTPSDENPASGSASLLGGGDADSEGSSFLERFRRHHAAEKSRSNSNSRAASPRSGVTGMTPGGVPGEQRGADSRGASLAASPQRPRTDQPGANEADSSRQQGSLSVPRAMGGAGVDAFT